MTGAIGEVAETALTKDSLTIAGDAAYKKTAKAMTDAYLKGDTKAFMIHAENMLHGMVARGKYVFKEGVTAKDFAELMVKSERMMKEKLGYTINKSLYKIANLADAIDLNVMRMAFTPSIYPAWYLAKKGFTSPVKMVNRRIQAALKPYIRIDGNISFTYFDDVVKIEIDNKNIHGTLLQLQDIDSELPKTYIYSLQRGAKADRYAILNIFKNAGEDFEKLHKDLTAYLLEYNKISTLDEYIETLATVNAKCNYAFAEEQQIYEGLLKGYETLGRIDTLKKNLELNEELIKEMKIKIQPFLDLNKSEGSDKLINQLIQLKDYHESKFLSDLDDGFIGNIPKEKI